MPNPSSGIRSQLAAAAVVVLLGISMLALPANAESGEAPLASFLFAEKRYEMHHAVAFRTTALNSRKGEEVTVVVLTQDPIDEEAVAAAVKDTGNWTGSGHLRVILRFEADGTLFWGMFQGDANNLQLENTEIEHEIDNGASRISGSLSQKGMSKFFDDEFALERAEFDISILATKG